MTETRRNVSYLSLFRPQTDSHQEIFNLTLLEATDEDFGMPPTLDALLGEGHPSVTKFLAASQDLDFDE